MLLNIDDRNPCINGSNLLCVVCICCQNSLKTQLIWPVFPNLINRGVSFNIFWNSPLSPCFDAYFTALGSQCSSPLGQAQCVGRRARARGQDVVLLLWERDRQTRHWWLVDAGVGRPHRTHGRVSYSEEMFDWYCQIQQIYYAYQLHLYCILLVLPKQRIL